MYSTQQKCEFGTRFDACGESVKRTRHPGYRETRQTSCDRKHSRRKLNRRNDFAFGKEAQYSDHSCGAASNSGGFGAQAWREYILNSTDTDFVEQLRTMAHELQATLLLDAISGGMTQQLADAAPFGSTILLYARLSDEECIIDARTALVKDLHFDGWFLANWAGKKNLIQILQLSQQAQSLVATDLQSPIHKRFALREAQKALETYINNMSAGKTLLVANPQEVRLDG
jgi:hypothetical protein